MGHNYRTRPCGTGPGSPQTSLTCARPPLRQTRIGNMNPDTILTALNATTILLGVIAAALIIGFTIDVARHR